MPLADRLSRINRAAQDIMPRGFAPGAGMLYPILSCIPAVFIHQVCPGGWAWFFASGSKHCLRCTHRCGSICRQGGYSDLLLALCHLPSFPNNRTRWFAGSLYNKFFPFGSPFPTFWVCSFCYWYGLMILLYLNQPGRRTVMTREFPSGEYAVIFPLCAVTMALAMERPIP